MFLNRLKLIASDVLGCSFEELSKLEEHVKSKDGTKSIFNLALLGNMKSNYQFKKSTIT